MPAFSEELTEIVKRLDEKGVTFENLRRDNSIVLQLARMGLFLPKGMAFSYNGAGVLLLSPLPEETGRVLGQLKADLGEKVNALAQGIPTLYRKPDSNSNIIVYSSDINGNTYPDFTPILYPSPDTKSFDVRAVFMLNDGSSETHMLDSMPNNAILHYFLWAVNIIGRPEDSQKYLPQLHTIKNALSGAYVFATGTGSWFGYKRKLAMVCHEIESELGALKGTPAPK